MAEIYSKAKLKRCNSLQLKLLVDYMSKHPNFASGSFSGPLGARQNALEWASLRRLLSEKGPDKSVEQWKQTWRDLKRRSRRLKDQAAVASGQQAAGNGADVPVLSKSTINVLETLGLECSVGVGPAEPTTGQSSSAPISAPCPCTAPSEPSPITPNASSPSNTTPPPSTAPPTPSLFQITTSSRPKSPIPSYRKRTAESKLISEYLKQQKVTTETLEKQNVLLEAQNNLIMELVEVLKRKKNNGT